MRRLSRRSSTQSQAAKADSRNQRFRSSSQPAKIVRVFVLARCMRGATAMHGIEKRIVYILRSESDPSRRYVGITNDVRARLHWHNHGPSGHTLSYRPWSLVVSMEFSSEREAVRFEKYLKS